MTAASGYLSLGRPVNEDLIYLTERSPNDTQRLGTQSHGVVRREVFLVDSSARPRPPSPPRLLRRRQGGGPRPRCPRRASQRDVRSARGGPPRRRRRPRDDDDDDSRRGEKEEATTEPEAASGHAKKRAVVPAHDDVSATVSPAVRKSPRGHAAPRHEPPPRNLEESLLVADEPTLSSTSSPRGHARERDEQRARLEHAMGTSPFARMGVTPPAKLPVDAKTAAEVLLATVCGEELPLDGVDGG